MNIFFAIAIFSALFLNSNLAGYLGIQQVVLCAMCPMFCYVLASSFNKQNYFKDIHNKNVLNIICIGIFVFFVKLAIGQDFFKESLCFFIIPMIIVLVLEHMDESQRSILQKILICFFVVECVIAIYEKINLVHLFGIDVDLSGVDDQDIEYAIINRTSAGFRSEALLGHPLLNAMVVSIILTFIVTAKDITIKYKIGLAILGFVGILCFNARGASIVTFVLILPYLFKLSKSLSKSSRDVFFVLMSIAIPLVICNIAGSSLGGRLFSGDTLLDVSAQSRLAVFSFYKHISFLDFLLGNTDNYRQIMLALGAGGIENGAIVLVIKYGFLLSAIFLPKLIKFHWNNLSIYGKTERWLIMIIFYGIGLMSPNLSMATVWLFWLYAYYAFRPCETVQNCAKEII